MLPWAVISVTRSGRLSAHAAEPRMTAAESWFLETETHQIRLAFCSTVSREYSTVFWRRTLTWLPDRASRPDTKSTSVTCGTLPTSRFRTFHSTSNRLSYSKTPSPSHTITQQPTRLTVPVLSSSLSPDMRLFVNGTKSSRL